MPRSPAARRIALLLSLAVLLVGAGCHEKSDEERGRDAMKEIEKSMIDYDSVALAQKTDPAVVAEVQRNLAAINEYQGEIDGKIDSVTVNALQAFQRTIGCSTMEWWAHLWNRLLGRCIIDNGLITDATRSSLAAAAAAAPARK